MAKAVVIGASAGALEALSTILPALPADYALPIMVVVHLPPDKKSILAEILQAKCLIKVCEAEDKEDIKGGTAYIAAPDYHLLVELDRRTSLSTEEPVLYSRPSIDVLFETAAEAYGEDLIGVVLTGANNDGALGLRAISEEGGTVLVQNPLTAYSATMPQSALDLCPHAQVLSLEEISTYLQEAAT